MLWLRQMGIALLSFVLVSLVLGVGGAALTALGVVVPPRDPIGSIAGVVLIVAALVAARRIYLVIERWDAVRSGRTARS